MGTEQIEFSAHDAKLIRKSIDEGPFSSPSEVVRAGLLLLEERLERERQATAKLRQILSDAEAGGVMRRDPREAWNKVILRHNGENV